jgi:hypothetical protein
MPQTAALPDTLIGPFGQNAPIQTAPKVMTSGEKAPGATSPVNDQHCSLVKRYGQGATFQAQGDRLPVQPATHDHCSIHRAP